MARFAIVAATAACTAPADSVHPADNRIFFPTGAAVAPDESVLFVANANSDLRYDSGSISVVPLQRIDDIVAAWRDRGDVPDGCRQDDDFLETLECEEAIVLDETRALGVRIGNFATELAVQERGDGALRLFVPTRGDPSITWIDWDGARLSCDASGEPFAACDDAHRLTFVQNDNDLPAIPVEPFGVYADSAGEIAVVTHLGSRTRPDAVTLIDSPRDGPAIASDFITGSFAPDRDGVRSASAVAGGPDGVIYVGSHTEDRIRLFTAARPPNGARPSPRRRRLPAR